MQAWSGKRGYANTNRKNPCVNWVGWRDQPGDPNALTSSANSKDRRPENLTISEAQESGREERYKPQTVG